MSPDESVPSAVVPVDATVRPGDDMFSTPGLPGLQQAVTHALGRPPIGPADVRLRPAAHRIDNMTTEGLFHVEVDVDGRTTRLFAKVLRPATSSPIMAFVPPEHHADVAANLNWLDEPRLYRSAIGSDLPPGLRLPVVHAIAEGDDRIVIWLEDVATVGTWTIDRYREAAYLLAAASARWPEDRLAEQGIGRRSYGYLFFGKLLNADVPLLRRPGHWEQPALRSLGGGALGARTERLIAAAPRLLETLEGLPHGLAHGDATPHNLLPTATGELVAVDWSYGCADAFGADLAQLFAGRFDVGDAIGERAEAVAEAVLSGYLDGLGTNGRRHVSETDVLVGWAIALAFRSVISATVLDLGTNVSDAPSDERLAQRVAVAETGLDLLERTDLI